MAIAYLGIAEVEVNGFSVSYVKNTIGFWGKSCVHLEKSTSMSYVNKSTENFVLRFSNTTEE